MESLETSTQPTGGPVRYSIYEIGGFWYFKAECIECEKSLRYDLGDSDFPLEYQRLAIGDDNTKKHLLFGMRCPHDLLSQSDIDRAEEISKAIAGINYA